MRHVAFLRAINTENRRLKMAELARIFENSGYANVSTYVASGNVIFDSTLPPDIEHIESAFEDEFKFRSEVFFLRVSKDVPTTHKESTSMRILDMKMTRRGLATVTIINDRFLRPDDGASGTAPNPRGLSRP